MPGQIIGPQPAGSDYIYTLQGGKFVKQEARHEDSKLTQERVQAIRERVTGNLVISMLKANMSEWPLSHLWFPRNTINCYELRNGKPPPDYERPKHMRGMLIAIQVRPWVLSIYKQAYDQLANEGSDAELHNANAQALAIPGLEKAADYGA
jgi:hypothetical protein